MTLMLLKIFLSKVAHLVRRSTEWRRPGTKACRSLVGISSSEHRSRGFRKPRGDTHREQLVTH